MLTFDKETGVKEECDWTLGLSLVALIHGLMFTVALISLLWNKFLYFLLQCILQSWSHPLPPLPVNCSG